MMQRAIHFLERETIVWGPIFLLSTLALSMKTWIPFDALVIALVGFYLSARFQKRGCVYALILLSIAACFKHAFFSQDHLWQLCIEGSLGCAFLITALTFEQGAERITSLESQVEMKQASLANLEEEFTKTQEAAQFTQLQLQDKMASFQKELEELQTDHSSLLILNEVLRKTTARHVQENDSLQRRFFDLSREKEALRAELDQVQKDLHFFSHSDELAVQNRQLMKELNAARYEKEQTHLINETVARLYARESLKAKEADQEAASLSDQLAAAKREVERIEKPLQEKLAAAHQTIETLSFQFEKANGEANQARAQLLKFNEIQTERNFLKERLQAATDELSFPKNMPISDETLHRLRQTESLFTQLKKQFEEKNQILHQTRAELFKADTELQALRQEKGALELSSLPKEVEEQLDEWGSQIAILEEENQELQILVTTLTEDSGKQKKK